MKTNAVYISLQLSNRR